MGPLQGIRIVEMDAIGPVPLAATILADMGADIVRIRRVSGHSPLADIGGSILNRSRTHVALDLKSDEGRAGALALIGRADALIEGFRPGVMERLGLGPDICLGSRPSLVYGRMTGWGQDGPLANRAGHDINYIALAGVLGMIGAQDRPPDPPLNLVGDYGGGAMFLALGVLGSLLSARTTGKGQIVDAAMTDGTAMLMAMFLALGQEGFWKPKRQANLLDGGAPFYRCYTCADGRFVAVGALEPQFFAALLSGLGVPADRYRQHDETRWPEMAVDFEAIFSTRNRDEWADLFADTDACVTPVLSLEEAGHAPHNAVRGTFARHEGCIHPAPAPRFSATPSQIGPAVTSNPAEVLARWEREMK